MAETKSKKKNKKNIPSGVAHIKASFNNTIINISSENYVKLKDVPEIIQKIINKKVNYNILRLAHRDVDLLNSNRKLLKLFPDLIFTDFNTGLRKTLRMEGII